jgi:phage tail-like protein
MNGDRNLRVFTDPDQWSRCRHESTALLEDGGVELTWDDPPLTAAPEPVDLAGLAFDRWCRGYRSRPSDGRVDTGTDGLIPDRGPTPGLLSRPRGIAIDDAQRLYVAESSGSSVQVIDLWAQRVLRRTPIGSAKYPKQQPVDCAARCCDALVLLAHPSALVVLEGRRSARPGPIVRRPECADGLEPSRVTAYADQVFVLWSSLDSSFAVIASPDGTITKVAEDATDIELLGPDAMVVARRPAQGLRRLRLRGRHWTDVEPWAASGFDGGAIARSADGRLALTTAEGWSWAGGSSAHHTTNGRVITYRLDSDQYRTRWGRVFVDACIPPGTEVSLGFITSDDDHVEDAIEWKPAARGAVAVRDPDATPPLPTRTSVDVPTMQPLFRRPEGREWAWAQIAADDAFETYETPVFAEPGRYLWLVIGFTGTERTSPRIRSVRIEVPGHRLLAELPQTFSRNDDDAAFLQRYLAPAEGMLHDLDSRAALRAVLLDPMTTPQESLAWLGSFLGLVLDRRWPDAARRELVATAFDLFRVRGTQRCLETLLSMYLRCPINIIENWRARGVAGGVLGEPPAGADAPAVNGGRRSSGQLGNFTVGGTTAGKNGYSATAHRFTVFVPKTLDREQRSVISDVIEDHKPAHTLMDICELGDGMRLGRSTRLELTTWVGQGTGWGPAVVGQFLAGGDGVIGTPALGSRVGIASVARGVRVG